jgi:hypothetical protein
MRARQTKFQKFCPCPAHRHTHKSLAVINRESPPPSVMQFTDILSFCFSILGLYGLAYYLRFLIPRNLLPYVSTVLTEAEHLLDRAESTAIIPRQNDYRSALTLYEAVVPLPTARHLTDQHSCANEFLRIRMESHRAPGILQQLWLAVWYGLTYRLYMLSSRVEAIKIKIEVCWNAFVFLLIP